MESDDRYQLATDVEQDAGAPGSSADEVGGDRVGIGGALLGVGSVGSGRGAATDVEEDLGEPGEVWPG